MSFRKQYLPRKIRSFLSLFLLSAALFTGLVSTEKAEATYYGYSNSSYNYSNWYGNNYWNSYYSQSKHSSKNGKSYRNSKNKKKHYSKGSKGSKGSTETFACQDCGCQNCRGGLSAITLKYNGASPAEVQAFDSHGKMIFGPSMVDPEGEVVLRDPDGSDFDATGAFCPVLDENGDKKSRKRLAKKIYVYVNGVHDTKVYTGCWARNGPGKELGSFTVAEAISVKGGEMCAVVGDCQGCKGGVNHLTLRYTGDQSGDILIKDGHGNTLAHSKYNAGDDILVHNGGHAISGAVSVYIDGHLNVKIPTSCQVPVGPGTQWGSFEVQKAESKENGPICGCLTDDPVPGPMTDYSDGPESYGVATHSIPAEGASLYIGSGAPDGEEAYVDDGLATADDNSGVDDEDSTTLQPGDQSINLCGATLVAGQEYVSRIPVTGSGFLSGWIDLNRDGVYSESEQLINDAVPNAGEDFIDVFTVIIPSDAFQSTSLLRLRYSSQQGLGPVGEAIDGEVEDCIIDLIATDTPT